ncbi:ORF6N domain-containing protein, partial [Leyella stercorea]
MTDIIVKTENGELVTNRDQLVVVDNIESLIKVIRGQQVMLDRDLATLYGVETKRLNEQVKRN